LAAEPAPQAVLGSALLDNAPMNDLHLVPHVATLGRAVRINQKGAEDLIRRGDVPLRGNQS
jgi:hypothetical protein